MLAGARLSALLIAAGLLGACARSPREYTSLTGASPSMFPPDGFCADEAARCATLVMRAYDMYDRWVGGGKIPFDWECPEDVLEDVRFARVVYGKSAGRTEPFALVGWDEETGSVCVAVRGSKARDWLENLKYQVARLAPPSDGAGEPDPRVHRGFVSIYHRETWRQMHRRVGGHTELQPPMREQIVAALGAVRARVARDIGVRDAPILVTGHSLGAALSTLAVFDVRKHFPEACVTHYTFASPRTGDVRFAEMYMDLGVPTWRVVNTCDLVPDLPLAGFDDVLLFQHVGTPVVFTCQYGFARGNHDLRNYRYAVEHTQHPGDPTYLTGDADHPRAEAGQ